jgi:VWFA-related protein
MKTRCHIWLFILCFSIPVSAQQVSRSAETPVQSTSSRDLKHRTPESAEQARRASRRIALDVVVEDISGKPVPNLQQQYFKILDNTSTPTIASFQAVEGFATKPPVEIILLLDTVNTAFQGVVQARQGVEKFLRQNDGHLPLPVSIVFLTDAGVKLNRPSRDGNALADDIAKLPTPIRMMGPAQGFSGLMQRFQLSVHTLTQLSTYEATRPGRKLLVWIGPGWPLLSGQAFQMSAKDQSAIFNSIVDLSTRLREARLTIYSVAPLDLSQGSQTRTFIYQTFLKGVQSASQADSGNLAVQVLAYQSGGQAFDPSGNLAEQISRCVSDAKAYYEISFDAVAANHADEYHGLEIKLEKPGLKARTNAAYYAQP